VLYKKGDYASALPCIPGMCREGTRFPRVSLPPRDGPCGRWGKRKSKGQRINWSPPCACFWWAPTQNRPSRCLRGTDLGHRQTHSTQWPGDMVLIESLYEAIEPRGSFQDDRCYVFLSVSFQVGLVMAILRLVGRSIALLRTGAFILKAAIADNKAPRGGNTWTSKRQRWWVVC
jgi:hypothetical protein